MCQTEIFIVMCGLHVCTAAKGAEMQSMKQCFRVTPCGQFVLQVLENVFNMQYIPYLHLKY